VDPDKRYTIKEFLAHPWIKAAGPTPREEKKGPSEMIRAFDASRIGEGERRYDFRSPGAVNLREVFDVGYAVHRQEEEAKRRKQAGAKAGAPDRLSGLAEDSDEADQDRMDVDGNEYSHSGKDATTSLEQRMRQTRIGEQEHRGRERERAPPPAASAAEAKGYGQHSAAVAAAARQQVRDRQKQRGAFELNIDGATLLGRRGMKPAAAKVGGA
jgi:serine/threonine-protein kinase RCK2